MDLTHILGGRQLFLLDPIESRYPQLARLNQDFGLCIVKTFNADSFSKNFTLVTARHQQADQTAISPSFASVAALEQHVSDNVVEILDDYLFDQVMTQSDHTIAEHMTTLA